MENSTHTNTFIVRLLKEVLPKKILVGSGNGGNSAPERCQHTGNKIGINIRRVPCQYVHSAIIIWCVEKNPNL